MKLTNLLRSMEEFGTIDYKVRGIVTYKISQFEQNAFSGTGQMIANSIRRISGFVATVVPYFVVGYVVYAYVERIHDEHSRKNPTDYAQFYEQGGEEVKYKKGKKVMKKKWPKHI